MSWFRIDDRSAFGPKILAAGNAAFGAWVRMGAHTSAQEHNGHLTEFEARSIATVQEIKRLVVVGLLDEVDDGYMIHDFLDYNPSAEEVQAMRAERAEAGRRGAAKTNAKRWPKQSANTSASDDKRPSADRQQTPTPLVGKSRDDTESLASRYPSPHPRSHPVPERKETREARDRPSGSSDFSADEDAESQTRMRVDVLHKLDEFSEKAAPFVPKAGES